MNAQINQEAAEWFVEFNTTADEPSRAIRRTFDTWLRQSPDHVRAYLDMFPIWDDAQHAHRRSATNPTANELIALARSAANVVQLGECSHAPQSPMTEQVAQTNHRPRWTATRPIAIAAGLLLAAVIATTWLYTQRGTYSTTTAEQRVITLPDGTNIALNAHSRIRVRYQGNARNIELLEGQALFKVAHDTTRPFIVDIDGTHIRAVGTQFDVNRKTTGTTVTVVEGKIAINSGSGDILPNPHISSSTPAPQATMPADADEILLTAGQRLTVNSTDEKQQISAVDPTTATSWTQNRLIFSNTPLTDVAEEFNRYNERPLIIQDKTLSDFKVSGVFSSTDVPSFLKFLRAQPGIEVNERSWEIRIKRH